MADFIFCASCRARSQSTARYCAECGQPLSTKPPQETVLTASAEWKPTQQSIHTPQQREEPQLQHNSVFSGIISARQPAVEGQVRGMQIRNETAPVTKRSVTTWSFRVERFNQSGDREHLVPVEMRGSGFVGSLSDGDWVRVSGKMRRGTFVASKVENLSTKAVIRPKPDLVVVVLLVSIIGAALTFLFLKEPGATQILDDSEQAEAYPIDEIPLIYDQDAQ